jgi:pilus assembly protein TadC
VTWLDPGTSEVFSDRRGLLIRFMYISCAISVLKDRGEVLYIRNTCGSLSSSMRTTTNSVPLSEAYNNVSDEMFETSGHLQS